MTLVLNLQKKHVEFEHHRIPIDKAQTLKFLEAASVQGKWDLDAFCPFVYAGEFNDSYFDRIRIQARRMNKELMDILKDNF